MDYLTTLGIAFGLAMDSLAVAIVTGLRFRRVTPRQVFRIGFHFGLFQFLMPIIGWLLGRSLTTYLEAYDHWIAFALLTGIGAKMLHSAWTEFEEQSRADPTRGMILVGLSVATSLDALAVGLSYAFLRLSVWWPAVATGVVTATLSSIGMIAGSRFGARGGRWAESFGGVVLIAIGVRILYVHLTGTPG